MKDWTYEEATKQADHLLAIGETEIFLHTNPPWKIATKCEPGGSHRLDLPTTVWFSGQDPKTGLDFRWSLDIEKDTANGKDYYEIDVERIRYALRELRGYALLGFRTYLADCLKKVMEKGNEIQGYADAQFTEAAQIRDLVKFHKRNK